MFSDGDNTAGIPSITSFTTYISQDLTVELRRALRVEPLGEDRFHRVYWFFPGGMPGLYLSDRCVAASVVNPFAVGERVER